MVVITGYGTIETAVETMKYGACEYVQKPFSAEELAAHVEQLAIQRQARIQARRDHAPRLSPLDSAEEAFVHDDRVPGGSFIAGSHVWVWIESGGCVRVGIDDLANQALGAVDEAGLPEPGLEVRCGDPLFSFRRGAETLRFPAPVSGKVRDLNGSLAGDPSRVARSPYRDGWVCRIEPSDLTGDLGRFLIGRAGAEWYVRETERLQALRKVQPNPGEPLAWETLRQEFFAGAAGRA
jgi:glycine cleavage system H lipoate-binding protein